MPNFKPLRISDPASRDLQAVAEYTHSEWGAKQKVVYLNLISQFAAPLKNKTAQAVTEAILFLLQPIQKYVKTLTFDNGKEFTQHTDIAKSLECDVFFVKPYHSWERGQNENANGLLRQYFPKSMELVNITMGSVFDAVDSLNSRLRKCLDFKTPYQVFEELAGLDMRKIMSYALIT